MTSLSFQGVSKSYDQVDALVGLNLEIQSGEFFAMVGSSGCGKSTAMRIAGGLETADDGEIIVDGHVITHLLPRDRGFGMVTQRNALLKSRTAAGNISLPLEVRKIHHDNIDERVAAEAHRFGVGHLLGRHRNELSGGETQAVQLARALVARPRVLLLDEPMARIDTDLRLQLRNDLLRIQHDYGVTTLLVTADQEDAMVLAQRVAVLHEGRLQQVGHPMDLYRKPVNTVVADFFGEPTMNLLSVKVVRHGGVRFYLVGGARIPAHHGPAERYEGAHIIIGVRPEDLRLDSGESIRAVTSSVERIENRGSSTVVHLKVDGLVDQSGESGACLVASCRGMGPRISDRPGVVIDPTRIHLFDPYTGAALLHPI